MQGEITSDMFGDISADNCNFMSVIPIASTNDLVSCMNAQCEDEAQKVSIMSGETSNVIDPLIIVCSTLGVVGIVVDGNGGHRLDHGSSRPLASETVDRWILDDPLEDEGLL